MKAKFIYWFANYNPDSASVRYRGKYPLEFIRKHYRINSYFITPGYSPINIIRFLRAYFSALLFRKKDSLIVIQRIHSNFIYSNLLLLLVKIQKKHTIYDLDDADYLEHKPNTIFAFTKHCCGLSVGSQELKKNLLKFNKSVSINTSPTPNLNIKKKGRSRIFTIGWIGCYGGGHKRSLFSDFFPALKSLPFKCRLILLGVHRAKDISFLHEHFKAYKNIELDLPQDINWGSEEEVQLRIAEFDIGIATLNDDEFHRSKSAFKTKQYLNNGVPVLSSNVPENNNFVKHGINGFLCSSPNEFRKSIIEIHSMDKNQYMQLSQKALQSSAGFQLPDYCEKIITFFHTDKQLNTH